MPTPSTITLVDDVLIASNNTSYQWFLNGDSLVGDTNQLFYPTQGGDYTVGITDSTGSCTAYSNVIHIDFLSIKDNKKIESIQIYPNPTNSDIELKGISSGKLIVYSISGQKVKEFDIAENKQYSLSELEKGTYLIEIQSEKGKNYTKIIKF
jgi:hypothetical protein